MRLHARSAAVLTAAGTASLLAVAAAATAGPASAGTPAATAPAATASTAGSHQVTLTFASRRGPAGLTDIAAAAGQKLPTGSARAAAVQARRNRIAADAPATGDLAAVTAFAARNHLTVASHTDWTATLDGDPSTLASVFATSLTTTSAGIRATTPLAVPAALAGVATGAVGLDDTPQQKPMDFPPSNGNWSFTPSSLTSHYGGLGTAVGDGHGVGIGIVSFAPYGFYPADWQTYVNAAGVNPPAVSLVSADGNAGTATAASSSAQSNVEVALDTQTVAAVAPAAQDFLVTAANTDGAAVAEYSKLADLAVAGQIQVISSSWGACEADYENGDAPGSEMDGVHQALLRAVAAGATILSASGDSGAFDCYYEGAYSQADIGVDYPASDPLVVGVGGTSTSSAGVASDSSWDNHFDSEPDGSGGGVSEIWTRPGYQPAGLGGSTSTMRQVPDLSAEADPYTGVPVYQAAGQYGAWSGVGGTSLAAPLVASWIADALSSTIPAGQHLLSGDGDIHSLLYTTPAAFNDVVDTTGNYWSYQAVKGYDDVTGLGTPHLPTFAATLAGAPHQVSAPPTTTPPTTTPPTTTPPTSAPTASAPVTTAPVTTPPVVSVAAPLPVLDRTAPAVTSRLTQTARKGQLVATVGASDLGSGLATVTGTVRDTDTGAPVLTVHSAGTFTVTVPGGRYALTVSATDASGNAAAPVTSTLAVGYDDAKLTRSGKWSTVKSSKDFDGSASKSSSKGATLTLKLTAGASGKLAIVSLGSGTVTVTVDGKAKTVHLKAGTVTVATYKSGKHTVKLAVASGTVTVDALTFS